MPVKKLFENENTTVGATTHYSTTEDNYE